MEKVELTKFKKVVYPNTFNLLNESKTPKKEDEIKSHIHNNVTVNLLSDFTPWQKQSVPAPLSNCTDKNIIISFYLDLKFDDENKVFMPVMYLNDYWNLNEDYQIINDTLEYIDFTITFYPISLFRWQLYTAQNVKNNWVYKLIGEDQFGQSDNENDAFKKMILETNIYLLIMTMIISLVHSIFEFFAFKNDIQFWKSRKSLEGLSVRSVIFNVFQSIVIALYVFDNDTNFVIKVSVFVGLLIELWKITKVVNIKVIYIFDGKLPFLQFSGKSTYIHSATQKYDKIAFKYLAWLFFPLFVGYSIYSLLYENHKGWYSWGLGTTYGFLLMFGFIMMFPQLFINYNLKSVAHLPWRMLTYKALNTFIDDIFAFAIKMPTLYRIGCFRDDIVFFIYLYQKWVYKVDPKRVNEFGTSQEMIDNEQDGSLIKKNE
ncbi:hypothetical protein A3Q56_04249 [Intoshia linei]|uniref:Cleft lip and palate transmembrane protein 1 n=1 Tax=Intoshia linei TaxID=1819745 RepID=A0A177B331_9BILA|nr:hypothetical protein A3Q56_04249 [Intoshia linei]